MNVCFKQTLDRVCNRQQKLITGLLLALAFEIASSLHYTQKRQMRKNFMWYVAKQTIYLVVTLFVCLVGNTIKSNFYFDMAGRYRTTSACDGV